MKQNEMAGCARRLLSLVAERRYPEAESALEDYRQAVARTLQDLPPADPRFGQLRDNCQRFMEQVRCQVLVGRAHAALRLTRSLRAGRYFGDRPKASPLCEFFA